jgi:hypothetical protein
MKSPDWSRSGRNRAPEVSRKRPSAPLPPAPLPPRVPAGEGRQRAIMLLGQRKKMELTTKICAELETLIGCYPSVEEAGVWKQALQRLE